MRVLICGAGAAGNALAFWLSRQNHKVTIVERAAALRASGLQVDLRGHGAEVMRRMGLEDQFRAMAIKEQGTAIVDRYGQRRAHFPANRSGEGLQSFTTDFEIMRGDLVQLLYDANAGVQYKFGATVRAIEQGRDRVEVVYSDGGKEEFDIVVGADGQNSQTRLLLLEDGAPDPIRYLNACFGYFTMPSAGEDRDATVFIASDSRLVMTRRHDPTKIQVYLTSGSRTIDASALKRSDAGQAKAAFTKAFQGAGWELDEYLRGLKDADDFYFDRPGVVKQETWSKGRVALIGDAAHCPTAMTGMGTSSAVVGAYVLAGEWAKLDHTSTAAIDEAFAAYHRIFSPFMAGVQRDLAEDGSSWLDWMPKSWWGIGLLNFGIGMAARFKLDVIARWLLREDTGDWKLPEYQSMDLRVYQSAVSSIG